MKKIVKYLLALLFIINLCGCTNKSQSFVLEENIDLTLVNTIKDKSYNRFYDLNKYYFLFEGTNNSDKKVTLKDKEFDTFYLTSNGKEIPGDIYHVFNADECYPGEKFYMTLAFTPEDLKINTVGFKYKDYNIEVDTKGVNSMSDYAEKKTENTYLLDYDDFAISYMSYKCRNGYIKNENNTIKKDGDTTLMLDFNIKNKSDKVIYIPDLPSDLNVCFEAYEVNEKDKFDSEMYQYYKELLPSIAAKDLATYRTYDLSENKEKIKKTVKTHFIAEHEDFSIYGFIINPNEEIDVTYTLKQGIDYNNIWFENPEDINLEFIMEDN